MERSKEEIIAWLRAKGCLNEFCYNFEHQRGGYRPSSLDELFSRNKQHSIDDAFTWAETAQGHDYWSDIDDQFNEWY